MGLAHPHWYLVNFLKCIFRSYENAHTAFSLVNGTKENEMADVSPLHGSMAGIYRFGPSRPQSKNTSGGIGLTFFSLHCQISTYLHAATLGDRKVGQISGTAQWQAIDHITS